MSNVTVSNVCWNPILYTCQEMELLFLVRFSFKRMNLLKKEIYYYTLLGFLLMAARRLTQPSTMFSQSVRQSATAMAPRGHQITVSRAVWRLQQLQQQQQQHQQPRPPPQQRPQHHPSSREYHCCSMAGIVSTMILWPMLLSM